MSSGKTVRVSLPPDLRAFVDAQLRAGAYETANEVMLEGLRLMESRTTVEAAPMRAVKRKVATGLAQARRGELHDGREFFSELKRSLRGRATKGAQR